MVKDSKPRAGSLAYLPRCRASRLIPRVRYWPPYEGDPKPLAFLGYKAGHLTTFYIDTTPNSPTQGQEVAKVSTVVVTPPMTAAGIVVYGEENGALKELTRVWSGDLPEVIKRKIPTWRPNEGDLKKLESLRDQIVEVRLIGMASPKLAGLSKKKPDLLEIKVGGDVEKALEYAVSKLGKEIQIEEAFKPGDFVDVIAVTKGRGFQGVVKRWGVKILPRKKRKGRRVVGAIGGRKPPYVMYTVPRPGQLGYHRRTEFNKRILLIEEDGMKLTPKGGFPHFGVAKTKCVLIEGTIPGTPKRPVVMRIPARPPPPIEPPEVTFAGILA
ncbi:MAG: 50S ribosomal protein L3 [Thaumarchaeota archaeon]|nr:MAG: 50S ribosomal protein L3 [Nitrososphaerota archaeon]